MAEPLTRPFYAQNRDDLLAPADITAMTGLDFMPGLLEGRLPATPISETLNYQLHEVALGRVVFRGAPEFGHTNPLGTTHGGWYGTLLDSAMACAVMTHLPVGRVYTTLEYKANILRPIPEGAMTLALCQTSHVGRSTGVAWGEIRGEADGNLYATGSTTCIVMDGTRPG